MAEYYVYENWTTDRARIHKGECGCYCNNGRGTHAGSSVRNGKWHGPRERDEAFRLAARLRRADTKGMSELRAVARRRLLIVKPKLQSEKSRREWRGHIS
jgi:hypothetical protein